MSMFAKQIAEAKPSDGSGMFFIAGQYPVVQLKQVKLTNSRDPKKGNAELFIIVCDILESRVAERPAGTQDVANILNSNHPGGKDDAKRFIMALFPGMAETAIDEQGVQALTSVEQPCKGKLLALECWEKVSTTKKNADGSPSVFTKHIWRAVSDEIQAQASELRAKAGLPPLN